MKIAIVGYSGSGKSTLAKKLAELHHCPVLYLDQVQFEAGWRERDREEARGLAEKFMEQDGWVIDGNYSAFCQERRLAEADQIVFFDFSRWVCLGQAVRRYLTYRNTTRESAAPGCPEKLDLEFVKWILRDGRTPQRREHYRQILERYPHKTVVLKTPRDRELFWEQQAAQAVL